MRILVFGAGVLGCNLARNLYRAGKDVNLLARGEWADKIEKNGLRIKDKLHIGTSVTRIPVVRALSPDDVYDAIFVVIRYTQIESVIPTLRENGTKNIIFVGNNVRAAETAAALPEKRVMFAFASSAGERTGERVESADMKKMTIGDIAGAPSGENIIRDIFDGTKYKLTYEPRMDDYLICHAAFVLPAAFACYKTGGNLKLVKRDTAYLNSLIDANIEGYRAIKGAGREILPKEDSEFEGEKYRKTCLRFFRLICATGLGKILVADHAMNATDEMSALNRDIKSFYDAEGAEYPTWRALESGAAKYLD